MVETCDTCACFPVCDRKFNMFGVFMGWADCNNWIPEVKRGKWYWDENDDLICSVCDKKWDENFYMECIYSEWTQFPPYCPNCGATMCKE